MVVSLDTQAPTPKPIGNFRHGPTIARNHFSSPSGHGYHHHYYASENNGSHKEGNKKSIALTALTLLAFLFFLNILQNCLQEQTEMNQNNGQQVLVLSRLKTHREADKRKDDVGEEASADVNDFETINAEENDGDGEKTYLKIAKRVLNTQTETKTTKPE